jgi:hypothetical protein
MTPRDWTLLAIDAANGDGLTPVQLQKALFLLSREMPDAVSEGFYHFVPYHYGPFDRRVYADAERLAQDGIVTIAQRSGENWSRFIINETGKSQAASLRRYVMRNATDYLGRVVEWVQRQSFEQLVRAIYEKYPDMKANSVFHG